MLLSTEPLERKHSEIVFKIQIFSFKKNAFKNVAWKMSAILSEPQCFKLKMGIEFQGSIKPKINGDLHSVKMHIRSKFGNPNFNR